MTKNQFQKKYNQFKRKKDKTEVVNLLKKYPEHYPNSSYYYELALNSYFTKTGEFKEIRDLLKKGLFIEPDNFQLNLELAHWYDMNLDKKSAKKYADKAKKILNNYQKELKELYSFVRDKN